MLQYMRVIELSQLLQHKQGTTACQVQTKLQRDDQGCSLLLQLVLAAGSTGWAAAGAAAAFPWAAVAAAAPAAAAWALLLLL